MRSLWNGLQIDVPDGWADASTIVLAPRTALSAGAKPTINLLVKRRPVDKDDVDASLNTYLKFMKESFGALENVATKELTVGSARAKSVVFSSAVDGVPFRQYTMLYFAPLPGGGGEEVSATVTQLHGDQTPVVEIERLLRSVQRTAPSVGALRGGR